MGVVYEAEQLSLGRRVALKVLPFAATMDPRHLQRFKNEAKAAASLRHDHIVQVYGVGCERGVHYYAMELIEGHTLAQVIDGLRLKPDKPASPDVTLDYAPAPDAPTAPVAALSTEKSGQRGREFYRAAAGLVADAADALEYAHSLGIVHRDVKPGNLLLDGSGRVYVGDFGLAKLGADAGLTMSGDLLGTLRYMSPEQALARHGLVDHRSDVYGLGAVLYELLTLRPAVGGSDRADILRHLAFEDPAAPRKLDRSVPAELETVALKALEKNPDHRYQSAKDLADDLRRWLGHQTIKAKPPGLGTKLGKWARRHRPVVWSTAVALVVTLATLAVGYARVSAAYRSEADERGKAVKALEQADQERRRADESYRRARAAVKQMLTRVGAEQVGAIPEMQETRRKLLEDAVAFYTELLRLDPRDAQTYFERGQVYVMLGRHDDAVRDYERALDLDPDNAGFHNTLAGTLFTHLHDLRRAIPHATRAIQIDPKNHGPYYLLMIAHRQLGQSDEAREAFLSFVALADGPAGTSILLAQGH
jgi:tetratricopeptide (TPR) repeat protein